MSSCSHDDGIGVTSRQQAAQDTLRALAHPSPALPTETAQPDDLTNLIHAIEAQGAADPAAMPEPRGPLVLIDPGHGGDDRGSPGLEGLWEGPLTLDLARRLQRSLHEIAPDVRTRLTRDADVYLSLEERAGMANALAADLFVSVHLNAANTEVERGGVATYVLDTNNDRNVLRLAARENGTRTTDVAPMQFLVGTLVRREQRERSERLAHAVQEKTLAQGRRLLPELADRGIKSAMFYVLVGAQMPSVLVEASFITQPDEARALTTPAYRDALALGMARGIAKYLAEN
ncbi:MAG: N-acetylmuramoyl-L-alanine amidase [Myxococcales bacterium]